jgi:hypothetical protein
MGGGGIAMAGTLRAVEVSQQFRKRNRPVPAADDGALYRPYNIPGGSRAVRLRTHAGAQKMELPCLSSQGVFQIRSENSARKLL